MFSDFDGLVTHGNTHNDAIRMAHEALAFHIEGMKEGGKPVPKPRSLADIEKEWWGWSDWKDSDYAVAAISTWPSSEAQRCPKVSKAKKILRTAGVW